MIINFVVPCYNEELVLPDTSHRLVTLIDQMVVDGLLSKESAVHFVDDGSVDRTWDIVCALRAERPDRFYGIKLSRNCGHQAAVLAGLRIVPGDALISIDADLQDDIAIIPTMVEEFKRGHDIVYGVRKARASDTRFKRYTAWTYYRLQRALGVNIVVDHADFRLISRRALNALQRYSEVNIFLRAIVPLLGFQSTKVYYDRSPRLAGESKYPFRRMVSLALDGITSFSTQPLRFIAYTGCTMALVSFFIGLWSIFVVLFTNLAVPGWASIIVPVAFVGGLQLASLGVIGEYIGKIYMEVKRRPLYEIEEILDKTAGNIKPMSQYGAPSASSEPERSAAGEAQKA